MWSVGQRCPTTAVTLDRRFPTAASATLGSGPRPYESALRDDTARVEVEARFCARTLGHQPAERMTAAVRRGTHGDTSFAPPVDILTTAT